MEQDPELTQRIRLHWTDNLGKIAPFAQPPDLELRSLRRARPLIDMAWLHQCELFIAMVSLASFGLGSETG
jgi:hypothetical protein